MTDLNTLTPHQKEIIFNALEGAYLLQPFGSSTEAECREIRDMFAPQEAEHANN